MVEIINIENFMEKTKYRDYGGGSLSVINEEAGIELFPDHSQFHIFIDGESATFTSRKELAEFLWQCAYFIDSEGRWKKNEYVGINYV